MILHESLFSHFCWIAVSFLLFLLTYQKYPGCELNYACSFFNRYLLQFKLTWEVIVMFVIFTPLNSIFFSFYCCIVSIVFSLNIWNSCVRYLIHLPQLQTLNVFVTIFDLMTFFEFKMKIVITHYIFMLILTRKKNCCYFSCTFQNLASASKQRKVKI